MLLNFRYALYLTKAWFRATINVIHMGSVRLYHGARFVIAATQFLILAIWFSSKLYSHFRKKPHLKVTP